MSESEIKRYGVTQRWSDAVVHRGVAYFVEVPDDPSLPPSEQIAQVLGQIDRRLAQVGSDRHRLLQVLVYLPDAADLECFNAAWDQWVPRGSAPSRACIHATLAAKDYRVELVITAALTDQR